jgi:hypothetical protein
MTGPPAERPVPDTVSRGSHEKQPREFGGAGRVPVVGDGDVLVEVCTPDRLARYLAAPNAEVKRRKDGSIRLVRLLPVADDRGHRGERHGRSTITTERVRNDWGALIGSNFNLKHKWTSTAWGAPAVNVQAEARKETRVQKLPSTGQTPRHL